MGYTILIIICIVLVIWFYFRFIKTHKDIKCNSVLFISGAPKTGKSFLGVYMAYKQYKKNRFKWRIKNVIFSMLGKEKEEEPLIYSNIPLNIKGVKVYKLTKDILTRKVRINKNSVVYVGEWSLVANSRLGQFYGVKNKVDYDRVNEELLLFTKLIGHETKGGGKVIIDSQTISDCHYAVKRVLSEYIYIHHNINIPFFKILFVKECTYSEDNATQQNFSEDIESGLKWLIIPKKKYYKMYDYCCYSVLTDNLNTDNVPYVVENRKDLKASDIVSFVDYKTINVNKGGCDDEEKN